MDDGRDPVLKQGENERRKDKQKQRVINCLQPPFLTPCTAGGGHKAKSGVTLGLGRREGGRKAF